ncbi:apolipoprotein N-acyltransferase [Trichlorobacter ammonificans]|nr:apolipoprotein N-acyltransferase [Trichlorobacter ammonificans]
MTALPGVPVALALCSGLLTALSFPKVELSFLAWIALIPLLTALEGQTPRAAFRLGFIAGLTAYAGLLYWVIIVMTEYGHLPLFAGIPLWLLLSCWLALFSGAASWAAVLGERWGIKAALIFPLAWVGADYLRSFLLTGFPWTMLGHSQYRLLPLIQVSDLTGVYGVTALIVLANVVLYRILRAVAGARVPYPAKSAAVLVLALAGTLWYGFHRLNLNQIPPAGTTLKVALIQGNIDQSVKWSPAFLDATLDIYSTLTRQAATQTRPDLVVWPESAAPFFFQDDGPPSQRIRGLARELDTAILFGSPALEQRNGRTAYLNSAFLLDRRGNLLGRSDKMHLVPFGEYVPLARLLPFVKKLVHGIGDFVPGREIRPLNASGLPLGILVCYEAIFPELARQHVASGSRVLVNITNDAWFGRSSAPYQHLAMAAFRAVETRTPLVRAANTGITALVDQNGHIKGMTPLFKEAVMVGEVRSGSAGAPYLLIGDLFARGCLLFCVLILLVQWRRNTNRIPRVTKGDAP